MKTSQLRKLITRYYRNRASPAERYIIDRWYASFDDDKSNVSWHKDRENLNELESRIIEKVLNQPGTVTWYKSSWSKIAASVLLVTSVSLSVYFLSREHSGDKQVTAGAQTITTGPGQLKRLTLPDSTKVILNANSTFKVLSGYGEKERLVALSGEAYFEVSKDTRHPFTIRTSDLNVRVLGTSFNVQSYTKLKTIKIQVSTGRVEVSDKERTLAVLHADQQVLYQKTTGRYALETIGSSAGPSWISGTVVLDQAGYDELVQAIYNIYGLEIKSTDPEVLGKTYNMTIRSARSYRQTLQQLCVMTGKSYREEGERGIVIY